MAMTGKQDKEIILPVGYKLADVHNVNNKGIK